MHEGLNLTLIQFLKFVGHNGNERFPVASKVGAESQSQVGGALPVQRYAQRIVGALVGLLVSPLTPVLSLTPFIFASITAYGVVFANQPVQFFGVIPITGKKLAIGMICFVSIFVLLDQRWVYGAGVYGAVAAAYGITKGGFSPRTWVLKYRHWSLRRKYKVLDGGKSPNDKKWLN